MAEIPLKASGNALIPLQVNGNASVSLGIEQMRVEIIDRPAYTGIYTITPTQDTQVLHTNALRMTDDITINPIPSNYGLVTWNGSVLTVS